MPDQKIEIELELQDKASQTIQQIAASVSEVIKHVGEMGKASSGTDSGVTRTVQSVTQLGDKSKETTRSLASMAAMLAPMAGPAGTVAAIGAGLIAATNALGDVAKGGLQLRNLSTDLNISIDDMSVMTRTFEAMGLSAEQAKEHLIAIGTALNSIRHYGAGSDIIRALNEQGFVDFAQKLLKQVEESKSTLEIVRGINDEFNKILVEKGPALAGNFRETMSGITESIGKDFNEVSKGIKPAVRLNIEDMARFWGLLSEYKNRLKNWAMEMLDNYMHYQIAFKNFITGLEPFTRKPPTDPNSERSLGGRRRKKTIDGKTEEETKKEGNSKLETIRDSLKGLFGTGTKPNSEQSLGRMFGGPVEAGKNYLVGEVRPEIYMGGGDARVIGMGGPEVIRPSSSGTIIADAGEALRAMQPAFAIGGAFTPGRASDQSGQSFFGGVIPSAGGGEPWQQVIQSAMTGTSASDDGMLVMPADQRREVDVRLALEKSGPSPSLNAEITFKNVPDGITTTADGDGFDNFRVNKSRALV